MGRLSTQYPRVLVLQEDPLDHRLLASANAWNCNSLPSLCQGSACTLSPQRTHTMRQQRCGLQEHHSKRKGRDELRAQGHHVVVFATAYDAAKETSFDHPNIPSVPNPFNLKNRTVCTVPRASRNNPSQMVYTSTQFDNFKCIRDLRSWRNPAFLRANAGLGLAVRLEIV
eukprot:4437927-Amphidinium_carterae.1